MMKATSAMNSTDPISFLPPICIWYGPVEEDKLRLLIVHTRSKLWNFTSKSQASGSAILIFS
jgi:hypothetical protein